jgi:hypothetical protein
VKRKHVLISILLALSFVFSCSIQKIGSNKSIDANQFALDYSLNIRRSDRLYKGKYLTISGEVGQSYTNKNNEKIVILMQKDKSFGVKCILNSSLTQLDRPLRQGETVKINGLCQGFEDYVVLSGCILLLN